MTLDHGPSKIEAMALTAFSTMSENNGSELEKLKAITTLN